MNKFNIDAFFEVLLGKDFDELVKKFPVLKKPDFFFQYALAKGYGFKGSLYDFRDEAEPAPLKERFKQTDRKLLYRSLVQIRDGDDKGQYCVSIGLLTGKKIENVFLLYQYYTTATSYCPEIVKIYNKNKVPKISDIKKDVSKLIKKEPYFTPFIKKKLKQWKNTKMIADAKLSRREMKEREFYGL